VPRAGPLRSKPPKPVELLAPVRGIARAGVHTGSPSRLFLPCADVWMLAVAALVARTGYECAMNTADAVRTPAHMRPVQIAIQGRTCFEDPLGAAHAASRRGAAALWSHGLPCSAD
jgi:hypothetical protein